MIRNGTKTQTRRVWKRWHVRVGGVYAMRTRLFGHGSEPRGWIRVTERREEPLGQISAADARAEGRYTVDEFARVWERINGWWDPYERVAVVTFEYVGEVRPN
jgi:hypothetical protein